MPLSTAPARSLPSLSDRATTTQSSAIRDLLDQAKRPGMISLAGGLPDAEHFPVAGLAAIAERVITSEGSRVLQYGPTAGDEATRLAMTSLFDPSVAPDQLIITTGSQQALDLIARVVVNPGDEIVVGDPDYLGALQVFRSYGADLWPIAIDGDGLDTAQLEDELRWGLRPKCLYLVPNFHNPSGASMTVERRAHLDELSQRYGFLVIEDDPYRALYYQGTEPAVGSGDPELTVRLRSTSKILAPGLRVGAAAAPAWLLDPMVTAKQSIDLHTSSLSQAVVTGALRSPWLSDHLTELRSWYRTKRDTLVSILRALFDDRIDLVEPHGGMFVWARFAPVDDTTVWLDRRLDRGVCFVPGQAFSVRRDLWSHARLSFATGSTDELILAVERMAATLDA